jgi:putative flippase GtrA
MKKLVAQFLKFGIVGAIAFCIDYGTLMLLSQGMGMNPVLAAAVSFSVSVVFNYIASMKYVFTHRDDLSKRAEFVIFIVLSVIGLGINELCMWLGTSFFGNGALAVTITKLFATAVVMVWNFVSRKKRLDAGNTGRGGTNAAE